MDAEMRLQLTLLLEDVRDEHARATGEERTYLQGKKDGMRTVLAIVLNRPEYLDGTRDVRRMREAAVKE